MSHEQVIPVNSYANVCDSIMDHTLFMRSILVEILLFSSWALNVAVLSVVERALWNRYQILGILALCLCATMCSGDTHAPAQQPKPTHARTHTHTHTHTHTQLQAHTRSSDKRQGTEHVGLG